MIAITGGNIVLRREPFPGDFIAAPEIHSVQTIIRAIRRFPKLSAAIEFLDLRANLEQSGLMSAIATLGQLDTLSEDQGLDSGSVSANTLDVEVDC